MTEFESSIKQSNRPAIELYTILSDFNQLGKALPSNKLSNWTSDGDSCKFVVEGIGQVGLKIANSQPYSELKYVGHGKVPFDFYLLVCLNENGLQSNVQVKVEASLNPLLKMMASSHIKKFIETLVEAIAKY